MVKEDQTPSPFTHGETDTFETNMEEIPKAIEDTEMTNAEETSSPMATSHVASDDKPVDAVMGLRVTLENLRQQIAHAVISGAPQDHLKGLQERAVTIKNCIMFLDEAQAFCVSPSTPTGEAVLGPGNHLNTSYPRSAHVIPPDLPIWQWQGNLVPISAYQNEQGSAIMVQ
ncbi:hypothetical protein G6F59_015756 [Rhizopus arrhizus]|nr:hypothetical protein G6F59_015756 [Rhizopus arrhizus]